MNILRFCVASNKESLKWIGVQFDKVPRGSSRIHAGKSKNLFHSSPHELATTTMCAHTLYACNHDIEQLALFVKPQALLPYLASLSLSIHLPN